jgi:hypothetical protein
MTRMLYKYRKNNAQWFRVATVLELIYKYLGIGQQRAAFFKNMHLVYTKMFDADNKILYIFEGKEPTWAFPVVIDWREKSGDVLPILGYDYKVLPLSN